MKRIYITIGALAAALLSLGIVSPALAFHAGGVAHCDGCHTMHNSENGVPVGVGTVGVAADFLTKGSDPSSTCLNCHKGSGSYHVFNNAGGATNLTPGGDFEWLTKTFTFTGRGSPINGHNLGHNIVAAQFGLVADPDLNTAPGGTFPAANLHCSSCHDPHGKVTSRAGVVMGSGSYGAADPGGGEIMGNFRLLADQNYNPATGVVFSAAAPVATTTSNGTAETNSAHTDYGSGMSEWCANCHTAFINTNVGSHVHPAGNGDDLGGTIAGNYNSYVATGQPLAGSAGTAYLALVPFERGTADRTTLDPTSTTGPAGSSNVMCLTCHRAHASAFKNAGRWDFTTELLAESHPLATDGGIDGDDVAAKYYGRDIETDFGPGQRSLCNKCHVQD
jgi:hypothetical protein